MGIVLFWLALSAMVVLVAFQAHSLVMIAGAWVIRSPALRPYGWSSTTLSGVSSFAYLILGGFTLAIITFLEQALSRAATENRLLRQAGKYALVVGSVWIVCFGLRLLIV